MDRKLVQEQESLLQILEPVTMPSLLCFSHPSVWSQKGRLVSGEGGEGRRCQQQSVVKGVNCGCISVTRKQWGVLLALLNVISAVSGDSPVSVTGFVGEQIVLPCIYKGHAPVPNLLVVWGISKRDILWKFIDGSDDLTEQDARFGNRTDLFKDQLEQGNWSILISDLRESDQDEYMCYIYKRITVGYNLEQADFINLSLGERAPTPGLYTPLPGPGLSGDQKTAIAFAVFFMSVYVAVIANSLIRRTCNKKQVSSTPKEAPNDDPLREVICTQNIVAAVPEHQDGASGKQKLLGNGAVQY